MDDGAPLELTARATGAVTIVYVAGEIDISTSERFQSFLGEQVGHEPDVLTVDLADVTFVGSEGLRVLIWLQTECTGRRIRLAIGECSTTVLRAFELTGLTAVLLGDEEATGHTS